MSKYETTVDALNEVANAIRFAAKELGNNDALTHMGALEAHGKCILDAAGMIAEALRDVATAINALDIK